jgi:hypothetical protein
VLIEEYRWAKEILAADQVSQNAPRVPRFFPFWGRVEVLDF